MRKIKRRPPNAAPLIIIILLMLIPMIAAYVYHFGFEALAAAVGTSGAF
jgi:hypothetical protein